MILTCPACAIRYRVGEAEFEGTAGRTVRCANCGHVWYASGPLPPAPEPPRASAADLGPPRSETPPPGPRIEAPDRATAAPPRKKRPAWGVAGWLAALVVLLLVIAVAVALVRRQLAAVWPSAARLAASVGHSAATPAAGLVIRQIKPSRTADGLRIDGEIADLGNGPRDVPRLRVTLQDTAQKEVQSEIVDPPKPRLQPGEVVHFETSFAHPPDTATGVVVTFAAP